MISNKIGAIKEMIINNKKVIENYFFMTILQVLNSFFYLLIYPYLIRTLGAEQYGVYVFATSVVSYFVFFITFGLDLPATKAIAENVDNKDKMQEILSSIFTAKTYLFFISIAVLAGLLWIVPKFYIYKEVIALCFISIYSYVLFPQWFFQGIQKMRVVTYIQLGVKILSLPVIFTMVKSAEDFFVYVAIITFSTLLGSIIAFFIIKYQYRLSIRWQDMRMLKHWLVEGKPFFYSSLAGSIKEYSIPIIIGSFFGMRDVAIYDLANKIVIVPRTLFMSVNAAIFPKLIVNIKNHIVKRIIRIEALVSVSVLVLIVIFGKYIVKIMGGEGMEDAYYLAVLLSITIISWLVVGAYISFVFIPNRKNYWVTTNQLVALVTFMIFTFVGLLLYDNILVLGGAIALSGISEIIYCKYQVSKNNMLK